MSRAPKTYGEMLFCFFRGSGAWAMLILFVAITMGKFFSGWFWWDALLFPVLYFFRGVSEWLAHSLLYHANPIPFLGLKIKGKAWRQHMEHHKDPFDLNRILITYKGALMPPFLLFFLIWPVSGSVDLALSLALASLILGAFTEIGHLICHCEIEHKTAFMRRFVFLHRYHHSTEPNSCYGVTSSLGDRLFGSAPEAVKSYNSDGRMIDNEFL